MLKDTFGEGNDNPFQEIPWKEEPGRLQSRVSQKSWTHDLAIKPTYFRIRKQGKYWYYLF